MPPLFSRAWLAWDASLRELSPLRDSSSAPRGVLSGDRPICEVLENVGSPGRIRTSDQPVNSRLLYH